MNKIIIGSLIIILISCIIYFFVHIFYTLNYIHPSKFSPDLSRVAGLNSQLLIIVRETGHRIKSIDDYQKSGYYPYNEDFSKSFSDCNVKIHIDNNMNSLNINYELYNQYGIIKSGNMLLFYDNPDNDNTFTTIQMLKTYTLDKNNRIQLVNNIRQVLVDCYDNEGIIYHRITNSRIYNFKIKTINVNPFLFQLPKNDKELKKFIAWQCSIEGTNQLKIDSWGNPIKFKINNGFLMAISAGPDGNSEQR